MISLFPSELDQKNLFTKQKHNIHTIYGNYENIELITKCQCMTHAYNDTLFIMIEWESHGL